MRERLVSLAKSLNKMGFKSEARNINRLIIHEIDKYAVMSGQARGTSSCNGTVLVEEEIDLEGWGVSFLPRSNGVVRETFQNPMEVVGLNQGYVPIKLTSTLRGYNPKTSNVMATAASSIVTKRLQEIETKYERTILYTNLKERAKVIGKKGVGFEKNPSNARGLSLTIELIIQVPANSPLCYEVVEEYKNENKFLFKITTGPAIQEVAPPPRTPVPQVPQQAPCLPPCECVCPEETVERGEAVIGLSGDTVVDQGRRRSPAAISGRGRGTVGRGRRRVDPAVSQETKTQTD